MKTKYITYSAIAVGLIVISLAVWLLWPKTPKVPEALVPISLENAVSRTVKGDIICFVNDVDRDIIHPILLNKNKLIICKDQYAREVLYEYTLPGTYVSHYLEDSRVRSTYGTRIKYLTLACKDDSSNKNNPLCLSIEIDPANKIIKCSRIDFSFDSNTMRIGKPIGVAYTELPTKIYEPYFLFQSSDLESIYAFDKQGKFVKTIELKQKVLIGYVVSSHSGIETWITGVCEKHIISYNLCNLELNKEKKAKIDFDFVFDDVILPRTCDYFLRLEIIIIKNVVFAYSQHDNHYSIIDVKGITEINRNNIYTTDKGVIYITYTDIRKKGYYLLSEEIFNEYKSLTDECNIFYPMIEFQGFIQYKFNDYYFINIYSHHRNVERYPTGYILDTFSLHDKVLNVISEFDYIYFYTDNLKIYTMKLKTLDEPNYTEKRLRNYTIVDTVK